MRLQPCEDRIVVASDEPEKTTGGGLILPPQAQDVPQTGTVIAVGPGRHTDQGVLIPVQFEPGDTVVYSRYGGTEIDVDGVTLLIFSSRDVLGKFIED